MKTTFKRSRLLSVLFTALLFVGFVPASPAQDTEAKFPEANQVVSDYPEQAQAYVALNILWDTLKAKSANTPDARAKRGTYYDTSSAIEQRQIIAGGKAASDFNERVFQLKMDKNFRATVLARYHIAEIRGEAPPQQTPPVSNGDMTDAMIKGAFFKASPILLITFVAIIFLIFARVRNTTSSETRDSKGLGADGLPPMPDALRVVKLAGVEYTVGVVSGLVLDKESRSETQVVTTVQQGQVYEMAGQLHTTPGRATTTSTTTHTDLVWLLTPQKTETSWTFTNGSLRTRSGHLLSAIVRLLPNGLMEFLAAYNHTTNQFELFPVTAHGTRRGFTSWLLSLLVGGVGFGTSLWIILSISPPEHKDHPWVYPVSLFVMGAIVAGVEAAIAVMVVKGNILKKRQALFGQMYVPRFRSFLEQRTMVLQKHFENGGI